MTEQQLLESARQGDEHAFGRLVETHRGGLYFHCYRMLGSAQDAEDALQETLLRAWRGLERFQGRSSTRSWLYTIATNASLRAIESRPRRVLPIDYGPPSDPHDAPGPPLTESVWVEPLADEGVELEDPGVVAPDARYEQRESIELAFIAALQLLPARQRAVLILRDVLGFSAREVGATLEISAAAVDSALQRAHRSVDERLPARSQQATLRALGDAGLSKIVDSYIDAWQRGDVEALTAMLSEDATISMPPMATWCRGRSAVGDFLAQRPLNGRNRWLARPLRASGQLAFAHYLVDGDGSARAHSISVVTLRGAEITEITAFLMPELFESFGLGDTPA
jgi:RNA polymerase sigma-70 factor (ECF subfamily)